MKFARFLFLPALMTAFVGSAFGQAPMVDPAMSGMAPAQGAPAMLFFQAEDGIRDKAT